MCEYCQGRENLCYKAQYSYGHGDVISLKEQEAINEVVDNYLVEVINQTGNPVLQVRSEALLRTLRGYSRVGRPAKPGEINMDPEVAINIAIKYCPMCGKLLGQGKKPMSIDEEVMQRLMRR